LASLDVNGVKRMVHSASPGKKTEIYLTKPKKARMSVALFGVGQSLMRSIFNEFTSIPRAEMWCPRKSISCEKNSHLDALQNSLALQRDWITLLTCCMCSGIDVDQMIMSSR
jgi:hypothetical protein